MWAYGWDFLWKLNVLRDRNLALLDRALQINVGNLLAQIGLSRENLDNAPFDLYVHICSLLDLLQQFTVCFDRKRAPTIEQVSLYYLTFQQRKKSYAWGGFGVKSTFSRLRISLLWSALQWVRGLSPGTAPPLSSRTFWPPPKNDKPSEATRVLRKSEARVTENFIVIFLLWKWKEQLMEKGLGW